MAFSSETESHSLRPTHNREMAASHPQIELDAFGS
jgi:hypothetical protein